MPNLSLAKTTARRAVPGLVFVDLGRTTRRHWNDHLTHAQRKRLVALLKASHGRPGNLSRRQRKQLVSIVRSFGPVSFAREIALTVASGRAKGRRKH
ncbi:MAG: hypothetical protein AAGC46_03065 [Solirubrobacteraceae bacterium]|nr:hypothetical protein [Patulibacter sp.]